MQINYKHLAYGFFERKKKESKTKEINNERKKEKERNKEITNERRPLFGQKTQKGPFQI
jgi:hypothetical protein